MVKKGGYLMLLLALLAGCSQTPSPAGMSLGTPAATPLFPIPTIPATSIQRAATIPRGIYVYSEHMAKFEDELAQAIQLPGVDGITLLIGWDSIETGKDVFDWTELDRWMGAAVAAGKNLILAIRAGQDTPCWLFQSPQCGEGYTSDYAGAMPLTFLVSPREGLGQSKCNSVIIAAPWDPVFLSEWDSLLLHISEHLKSTGTYDSLVSLRLTGINRTTAELRLPAEMLTSPCVTNSIETWLEATPPYRPARLLKAWDALTDSFQKNFPEKFFGIEIIPNASGATKMEYAFPAIDNKGCAFQPPWPTHPNDPNFVKGTCINDGTLADQNEPLLSLASKKFSGRLSVSYQNLDPTYPASSYVIQAANTWETAIGYQVNDYDNLQRSACSGSSLNPGPCDLDSYLKLLEVGVYPLGKEDPTRALYIEVLPPDAIRFPDAVLHAHNELFALP